MKEEIEEEITEARGHPSIVSSKLYIPDVLADRHAGNNLFDRLALLLLLLRVELGLQLEDLA